MFIISLREQMGFLKVILLKIIFFNRKWISDTSSWTWHMPLITPVLVDQTVQPIMALTLRLVHLN